MKKTILALAVAAAAPAVLAAPSTEEMWQTIQQQQREIERLKAEQKQTDAKVEATAEAVEKGSFGGSKLADWATRTSIGGYAEHHFNHYNDADDKVDAHRFVLFVNHQYSDTVRLFTELELEHSLAGDGKPGEVELEQAYIQWDYAENHSVDGGLFLIPVGILNETHEPNTFYGVERNNVEKNIIPTTWWETGVKFHGEIAPGLRYDVAVHSGLKADDGGKVRGGRQKSANAIAEDLAATARIKYTGVKGLELAATVQQQQDITQGAGVDKNDALLLEAHARYTVAGLTLTALAAQWDINGDKFEADGRDEQEGWYAEASYKITPKLGVFVRQSEWDNNAGNSADTEVEEVAIGVNYWLTDRVALKADLIDADSDEGSKDPNNTVTKADSFNLGIGWSF